MTARRSHAAVLTLVALLVGGSACTVQLPMPWGQEAVRSALGWSKTLGGVELEHGRCQIDGATNAASRCEFDAVTCYAGCGAELSAFTDRVDAHNADLIRGGRRHTLGWTLVLKGTIRLEYAEPWLFAADRVNVDCQNARVIVGGEVPTLPGVAMIPGQIGYEHPDLERLRPGDIVVAPDGRQAPIRFVCTDEDPCWHEETGVFNLGWPWIGSAARETYISQGAAVIMSGEQVTFTNACPIYDRAKWERGLRDRPVSVIRTPGWDTEDAWVTSNFNHPGDYAHVNTSKSSTGGTNGVRYTGGAQIDTSIIQQHVKLLEEGYPPEAIGAGWLLLASTTRFQPRQLMNFVTRCFIVAAGHRMEMEGVCEGPVQMIWAPTGVSSLLFTGAMNHQDADASAGLPWIDLGYRLEKWQPTAAQLRFPHILLRPGRRVLVRARGKPIYLHIEGSVRGVERILDIPDGSFVTGSVACLDRPGYDCGALDTPD
jgi:hypothetical protein